jgi:hypothetical protein
MPYQKGIFLSSEYLHQVSFQEFHDYNHKRGLVVLKLLHKCVQREVTLKKMILHN